MSEALFRKFEDFKDFEAYKERVKEELIPKINGSVCVMSLVPDTDDQVDVKFAIELGLAIMLDKPIIALVTPGRKIPEKLVRFADRIVEVNKNMLSDPTASKRIKETLEDLMKEKGINLGENSEE